MTRLSTFADFNSSPYLSLDLKNDTMGLQFTVIHIFLDLRKNVS